MSGAKAGRAGRGSPHIRNPSPAVPSSTPVCQIPVGHQQPGLLTSHPMTLSPQGPLTGLSGTTSWEHRTETTQCICLVSLWPATLSCPSHLDCIPGYLSQDVVLSTCTAWGQAPCGAGPGSASCPLHTPVPAGAALTMVAPTLLSAGFHMARVSGDCGSPSHSSLAP